ncbi:hypothetical protein OSB04_002517 [Centaurea solstitialis]|uniref:SWIM-type domain-containing protein n=1 Tax=Centaurea solstitialis TaxID=347529 RepID=A0AA38U5P1_9ASTR|nr:hypothetical protein OSB04_002517 [Centaurea solstitialis]
MIRAFTLIVHYDGCFMYQPLRYDNGKTFEVTVERITYEEMVSFIEFDTKTTISALYYCIPGNELHKGLMKVDNNHDVECLFDISENYGPIEVEGEAEIDKNADVESDLDGLDDVDIEYEGEDDEMSDVHSIDHLSEGEDEVMQVRKGKQEGQSLPKEKPKLSVKIDRERSSSTSYALANGFSIWYERSSSTSLITRCGSRPPRNPTKGKQRKGKRYPSAEKGGKQQCQWRCYARWMKKEQSFQVIFINPNEKTYFDRFYVCLNGLKEGWKRGCRRVIALDGCFLKGVCGGELLTAIGRDGNNHIFPVAWAVVNVENKDNWTWFITLVREDLEVETGEGLTLISDQHKGLVQAVKDVMPNAEHRQCARHIYENFRKVFSGVEFRNLFWRAIRHKPIITMLEAIRTILMERMNNMRRISDTWVEDICPSIKKKLDIAKDQQRFWSVIPRGLSMFEVRLGNDVFIVDEDKKTCTCRMWQLSELPCHHVVAALFYIHKHPEDYVPGWFRKDMYKVAYNHDLLPVQGMNQWKINEWNNPLPPKLKRMPGRPKKQRKKAIREPSPHHGKVSRQGSVMTCQRCFQLGHNKRGCKQNATHGPFKPSKPPGRPRKTQEGSVDKADKGSVDKGKGMMADKGIVDKADKGKMAYKGGVEKGSSETPIVGGFMRDARKTFQPPQNHEGKGKREKAPLPPRRRHSERIAKMPKPPIKGPGEPSVRPIDIE